MFSPDGTLISAAAAPHCGVQMMMEMVTMMIVVVVVTADDSDDNDAGNSKRLDTLLRWVSV